METRPFLRSIKACLGDFVWLDFTHASLPEAHRLLGQHVALQVHKIITHRLETLPPTRIAQLFDQVQHCKQALFQKVSDSHVEPLLRVALDEYLECLAAWSRGSGLDNYHHPALAPHQPIGSLELALFLQNDSTGCQTGMLRCDDGTITLWHTEEDIETEPGTGFDQLRIASFNVQEGQRQVVINAFIYPDLLPGPAFGWRSDGCVQAADLLYIKPLAQGTPAILGNIVTWLALRLGAAYDTQALIEAMLPTFDGYALNVATVKGGEVQALKCEFGASYSLQSKLEKKPGSYVYQANIFTDGADPRIQEIEDLVLEERRWFEDRAENTRHLMEARGEAKADPGELRALFKMITSQVGEKWAYANQHVKAYFLCHLTQNEAELWLGVGPAFPDDKPTVIKIIF
ncbi:MAG: hypothetical protein C3F13_06200 [Anaerolineales bacterium]|nr:hypothetical protein [Anaerolineae bacterium]PWB54606.1 MAG: hypothetical protein C3F13_06200 [Anaerolineales bacterium]